jgi:hypothetical protein
MSQPYANSGARVFISAAVVTEPADAAAYAALSWTEIGDVLSLSGFGDEAQILSTATLQDERVFKAKGPRDSGTLEITCLNREDDTGQIAAVAAEQTAYNYPIKVELPNKLTTGGTNGLKYMIGLVSSRRLGAIDPTSFGQIAFMVALNSKITSVAAT